MLYEHKTSVREITLKVESSQTVNENVTEHFISILNVPTRLQIHENVQTFKREPPFPLEHGATHLVGQSRVGTNHH